MTIPPSTRQRPEVVAAAPRCELGEGPCWDPRGNRLLWVDLLRGLVHIREAGDTFRTVEVGQPVSAIAVDDAGWVLAVETGIQRRDASFAITETIDLLPRPTLVRMNDAALDSRGRFWVGSLAYDERPGLGTLFRVDPDGSWTEVISGLGISNGIAWSPDERVMYHVDSAAGVVWAREFDAATGEVGAAREWFRTDDRDGDPDGIAVDVEGGLWVALWGGARVVRLDADARVTAELAVPALQASSVAFGDPDLRTLYITTAAVGLDERTAQAYPGSGRLFRARVDIPGLPVGRA